MASFFLGFLFVHWFREADVCLIVAWEWKCGASRKNRIPFYFLKGMFDEMWGILLFFMFAVSRETANICLPFVGYSSEAIVCLVGKKERRARGAVR